MNKQTYHIRIIQVSILIASFVLIGKLAELQLFNQSLKDQARRTTLQKRTIYPSRGLIYDRNQSVMVINESLYDLDVIYKELNPDMDTLLLCKLLNIDEAQFLKNIEKNWKGRRFRKSIPFTFLKKINPKEFSNFQEHLHEFPGFYPILRNVRSYPHKNAAHVLGYLNEVDQSQIRGSKGSYSMGDYIGVSGLEKSYENQLKGIKGIEYFLKDNIGRPAGSFSNGESDSAAVVGTDLISTLDLSLQQYGETLMQGKKGSIVAIEPSTGEILSMISSPSYDPNLLRIDRNRDNSVKQLITDTLNRPFIDRSVMAKYPPGSIFKPILSLIALQEGILWENRKIKCDGSYEINTKGQSQGCRDHPTPYNLEIALQHSCNTYFYQTIRELLEIEGYTKPSIGLNKIVAYLDEFGLGRKLGLDNLHENSGFIPDAAFYNRLYNTRHSEWRSTYILSLGIGQGELELTTLQMANLATAIANRGYYYTPHLIKAFKDSEVSIPNKYRTKHSISIDQKHYNSVIDGMERVIHSGTGYQAYHPELQVCGKTGTSQNPQGPDHSVFFAFAPKDNPKIAVAVYVENAGSGGYTACPIGGLIIEKYLKGEISARKKIVEKRIRELDLINKT